MAATLRRSLRTIVLHISEIGNSNTVCCGTGKNKGICGPKRDSWDLGIGRIRGGGSVSVRGHLWADEGALSNCPVVRDARAGLGVCWILSAL